MATAGADNLMESIRSADSPTHTIEGPSGRPTLHQTLEEALASGEFSDITIVTRDTSFRLHKLILKSRCSKLLDQLGSSSKVELNADPNAVRHVLRYVYTNTTAIPKEDLMAVAMAAEVLGVTELETECIRAHLNSQQLNPQNCLEIWQQASRIHDQDIITRAKAVALDTFAKVQKTAAFKDLPFTNLKEYLTDNGLSVRSVEERVGAALTWIRAESEGRACHLPELLRALPLAKVRSWFLDHLSTDPLIQAQPQAVLILDNAYKEITDESRQKADVPVAAGISKPPGDRYLLVVGAYIDNNHSTEVHAVRLDENLSTISLGNIKANFPDCWEKTNCCIIGDVLYAAGLGEKMDEVWLYNLTDRTSRQIARLNTGRQGHAMSAAQDGRIYIMGGYSGSSPPFTDYATIERVDVSSTPSCRVISHLQHKEAFRLACCPVEGGQTLLVCGARDKQQHVQTIQVYSTKTATVTHTINLPDTSESWVFGATEVREHFIVVASTYTAVIKLHDVLHGRTDSLHLTKHYVSPNYMCAVALDDSGTHLLLLGGKPKHNQPKHYAYTARVVDIIQDTPGGWQKSDLPWSLGECMMYGGYAIAHIYINRT